MALDRLMNLLAHRVSCFSCILVCLVIPMCFTQSCPALWSTFGCQ